MTKKPALWKPIYTKLVLMVFTLAVISAMVLWVCSPTLYKCRS